jgi:hypothetical protein
MLAAYSSDIKHDMYIWLGDAACSSAGVLILVLHFMQASDGHRGVGGLQLGELQATTALHAPAPW